MNDDDLYDVRFFDLVDLSGLPPQGSLETSSGLRSDPGPYPTNLIEQVETAWRTPYRDLTCAQVSTLVQQKMGLEWLGGPAIEFASRYPRATIRNYPGEIGVSCLRSAAELVKIAKSEFATWVRGDFSWMDEVLLDRRLRAEAGAALAAARALVGGQ